MAPSRFCSQSQCKGSPKTRGSRAVLTHGQTAESTRFSWQDPTARPVQSSVNPSCSVSPLRLEQGYVPTARTSFLHPVAKRHDIYT